MAGLSLLSLLKQTPDGGLYGDGLDLSSSFPSLGMNPGAVSSGSSFFSNPAAASVVGSIFGAVGSMAGSYYAAKSAKSNLKFQSKMAEINARIADMGSRNEILKGQRESGRLTSKAGQVKRAQRAQLAANGVDLGVGSAVELQASTDIVKEMDALTIQANALRAAWGFKQEGLNFQNAAAIGNANANSVSPAASAFGSLVTSAPRVAEAWYRYSQGAK
jgi:hypothetical protein